MAVADERGGREALDRYLALGAMSWPEIKALSQRIADAPSDGEALSIAKVNNLVDSSGRLHGNPVKAVELTDGRVVDVQILGFRHDRGADGKSRGITFAFSDSIVFAPMAARRKHLLEYLEARRQAEEAEDMEALKALEELGIAEATISWENTDLRAWLNEGMPALEAPAGVDSGQPTGLLVPPDLVQCVTPVMKKSISGHLEDEDAGVVALNDKFWVLSTAEIFGPQTWYSASALNVLVNAEGHQYQLYHDMAVDESKANPVLFKDLIGASKPQSSYWTRTQCPKSGKMSRFRFISGEGNALFKGGASSRHCVAPCFCV